MFSQDWVDHMKMVMNEGEVGDTYDFQRIWIGADRFIYRDSARTYVKTESGHRSSLYENRHLVIEAPFVL